MAKALTLLTHKLKKGPGFFIFFFFFQFVGCERTGRRWLSQTRLMVYAPFSTAIASHDVYPRTARRANDEQIENITVEKMKMRARQTVRQSDTPYLWIYRAI